MSDHVLLDVYLGSFWSLKDQILLKMPVVSLSGIKFSTCHLA